jgi:hypothetical protein
MKTCENCGERVYKLGCVNCNESAYIEEQEQLTALYDSEAERAVLEDGHLGPQANKRHDLRRDLAHD